MVRSGSNGGSGDRLGQQIARLRRQAGLTQAELARALGISRQTLIALEQGEREPHLRLAVALADRLGVPLEQLVAPWRERPPVRPDRWLTASAPRHAMPVVWAQVADALVAAPWELAAGGQPDGWWDPHTQEVVPLPQARDPAGVVLVGGCDPFLPWLAARFQAALPGRHLQGIWLSSRAALAALANGTLHLAGSHLYDPASGRYNQVQAALPIPVYLMPYLQWEEGLIQQAPDQPVRQWAVREPGSEAEALWRRAAPAGAENLPVVRFSRHQRLVEFVARHPQTAGVSLGALAAMQGLAFTPWAREDFQWCCPLAFTNQWWFEAWAQLVQPDALAPWFARLPHIAPAG